MSPSAISVYNILIAYWAGGCIDVLIESVNAMVVN